jgi:hypothetical protein
MEASRTGHIYLTEGLLSAENPRRRQGMTNAVSLTQFLMLTIVLTVGVGGIIAMALRMNIAENWEERRCDPYVIPTAGFYKPPEDPRTPSEFAADNWSFCQKQYVQNAISIAAEGPKALVAVEDATVGLVQDMVGVVADVFYNVWRFCYQTYTSFMDRMKIAARLFQNFLINMYSMVGRLNAAATSIIFGLIAVITSVINSIQVTLIVAIIVVGIILLLQILLFFILLPISGLIITVTAIISVAVVIVATAIAAATVAELFHPGHCFATGTSVALKAGGTKPIETIRIGDVLADGGRVTATHAFWSNDPLYDLAGVHVTGDHLVHHEGQRVPVRNHPAAFLLPPTLFARLQGGQNLWCLTTTTRTIPVGSLVFADWEEIAETDTAALTKWHAAVWATLNPGEPLKEPKALDSEAGLHPDSIVQVKTWSGLVKKRIADVAIGDRIVDSRDTVTMVTGIVKIAGPEAEAVEIAGWDGPAIVSSATWIQAAGTWTQASGLGIPRDIHLIEWIHLYTESGSFITEGLWSVRDASDIGTANLKPLVAAIVLEESARSK